MSMPCPECGHIKTKVYDSRVLPFGGSMILRKRECKKCQYRFATKEIIMKDYTIRQNRPFKKS